MVIPCRHLGYLHMMSDRTSVLSDGIQVHGQRRHVEITGVTGVNPVLRKDKRTVLRRHCYSKVCLHLCKERVGTPYCHFHVGDSADHRYLGRTSGLNSHLLGTEEDRLIPRYRLLLAGTCLDSVHCGIQRDRTGHIRVPVPRIHRPAAGHIHDIDCKFIDICCLF